MQSIDRILIIIPAQLGDVLLCTPLIHAARTRWPQARIDVLGIAGSLAMLQGNPEVDGLIEVSRSGGLKTQWRQARALWRRYDLALVTRMGDRAHLYGVVAARTRSAVVPADGPGRVWKRRAAQHAVSHHDRHEVLEKLELLAPWTEAPASVALQPPAAAPLPDTIQAQLRHPRVVVHVPSMWTYKQWPPSHFRSVIGGLLADGVQVVLTGSASSHDMQLVEPLRDLADAPDLLVVAGLLDLSQLRTLLEGADAYLGPDTSVTHLAAALGVPIVTLFGPTPPNHFGPWPKDHPPSTPWLRRAQRQQVGNIVLLQGPDLPERQCVPCGRMGCEDRHDSESACLAGLEPQRVLAELKSLLHLRQTA